MEMIVIMNQGERITASQLPAKLWERDPALSMADSSGPGNPSLSFPEQVKEFEISRIREALLRAGGVKTDAARSLGISRYALLRKMKALKMEE